MVKHMLKIAKVVTNNTSNRYLKNIENVIGTSGIDTFVGDVEIIHSMEKW